MENQLSETYTNIVRQLEGGGTVKEVRPLPGSFSNETALLTYETAVGPKQVVVQRYAVFGDYDRGEKAEREFRTLALLQKHHIPAPTPLLLDKSGDLLDSPGIVTSFVPGQQIMLPQNEASWIAELAKTLARIHAIPLTAVERALLLNGNEEVTGFLNGGHVTEKMRAHRDGTAVWHAVHDLLPTIQPVPPALMHVDYWLGNILWHN
jgi:aminoglycoside phosphotransferase (APT) family kinase protein